MFFYNIQRSCYTFFFFFFNDTATTEIYTLSLHDALPISYEKILDSWQFMARAAGGAPLAPGHEELGFNDAAWNVWPFNARSEEHTSELQSQSNLVCRLLLEKKKKTHLNHRAEPVPYTPCQ